MEENTMTEQYLELDEEQLQAITGAGESESSSSTPAHDKLVKLFDQHVTHSFSAPAQLALDNPSKANWHNEQANATWDQTKPFYPPENSQEAKDPVASPKKGCLGCFSFK